MEKRTRSYEEIQLDFAFIAKETEASRGMETNRTPERPVPLATRSYGVTKSVSKAHSAMLAASLAEVSGSLLAVFEFCEAALTRALDVVSLRKGDVFSQDELRSLRGIGQAQWLLNEAHMRREMRTTKVGKKTKKTMNDE